MNLNVFVVIVVERDLSACICTCIFSKCFIVIWVAVDLEPILETLGRKNECTLDRTPLTSPSEGTLHTHIHAFILT